MTTGLLTEKEQRRLDTGPLRGQAALFDEQYAATGGQDGKSWHQQGETITEQAGGR